MNTPRDADRRLVRFLKTHAPRAPEASPSLEEAIVEASRRPLGGGTRRTTGARWVGYAAAMGALAAGVVLHVAGSFSPSAEKSGHEADLEQFVEASWDGTFADEGDLDTAYAMVLLDDAP
jgi:hypothetical protein